MRVAKISNATEPSPSFELDYCPWRILLCCNAKGEIWFTLGWRSLLLVSQPLSPCACLSFSVPIATWRGSS